MQLSVEEGKPSTWGLDPLFHTHVKLFLSEVQSMFRPKVDGPNDVYADAVYFIRFHPRNPGRPVRLVHVEGYIVHVTQFHKVCSSQENYVLCVWPVAVTQSETSIGELELSLTHAIERSCRFYARASGS
jgi:hypothetical protein